VFYSIYFIFSFLKKVGSNKNLGKETLRILFKEENFEK